MKYMTSTHTFTHTYREHSDSHTVHKVHTYIGIHMLHHMGNIHTCSTQVVWMQTSLQLHTHTHLMVSRAVHPDPIKTSSSNSCSITPTKTEQQTNKAQITRWYTYQHQIEPWMWCSPIGMYTTGGSEECDRNLHFLKSVASMCLVAISSSLRKWGTSWGDGRGGQGTEQVSAQGKVLWYVRLLNTCINLSLLHWLSHTSFQYKLAFNTN